MRTWTLALTLLASTSVSLGGQPTKRPSDEERGRELYGRHCWQCHGERNRGNGPATTALVHRVPNLSGGNTGVDEAAVKIVLRGKSAMPAFAQSFDDADARRVLRYMASLGDRKSFKPATKPAPKRPKPPPEDEAEGGEVGAEVPPVAPTDPAPTPDAPEE